MGTNRTRMAGIAVGAAILAVSGAPGSGALAQDVDVSVCGVVQEYTPPTTRAAGSVTVDGDSFALAPGARLSGGIRAGSERCLVFTFDDSGRIADVSDVSGAGEASAASRRVMPGAGTDVDGDEGVDAPETRAASAEGDEDTLVADAGPGAPEQADAIVVSGEDLPRTGGSAPTGGIFSLVSLAAAMLAGLGTFVLRRDA